MKYAFSILSIFIFITSCNKTKKTTNNATDKIIYDVVFRENLAGSYEKLKTSENSFNFYYTYTDRGRGPSVFRKNNFK